MVRVICGPKKDQRGRIEMINVTIAQMILSNGGLRILEIHGYLATNNTSRSELFQFAVSQIHNSMQIAMDLRLW